MAFVVIATRQTAKDVNGDEAIVTKILNNYRSKDVVKNSRREEFDVFVESIRKDEKGCLSKACCPGVRRWET